MFSNPCFHVCSNASRIKRKQNGKTDEENFSKFSQKRKHQFITRKKTSILRECLKRIKFAHESVKAKKYLSLKEFQGKCARMGFIAKYFFDLLSSREALEKAKKAQKNVRNSIENKKVYSYVRLALNERERTEIKLCKFLCYVFAINGNDDRMCETKKKKGEKKEQEMKTLNVFSFLVLFLSFKVLS